MWEVRYHPEALDERDKLPVQERTAIANAVEKLEHFGPNLPHPHQSAVQGSGAEGIRELRPRAGRSRWRPLYGRVEDVFVILAVGPEAQTDRRRFKRAVRAAKERLADIESEEG
jgi:hypothetical protein